MGNICGVWKLMNMLAIRLNIVLGMQLIIILITQIVIIMIVMVSKIKLFAMPGIYVYGAGTLTMAYLAVAPPSHLLLAEGTTKALSKQLFWKVLERKLNALSKPLFGWLR